MLSPLIRKWMKTLSLDDIVKIRTQAALEADKRFSTREFACTHGKDLNCPSCADALNLIFANIG